MKNIVLAIVLSTLGFQNLHAQRFAFVDTDYLLNQMPDYRSAQKEIDQMSENWQKEIEQKYMEWPMHDEEMAEEDYDHIFGGFKVNYK